MKKKTVSMNRVFHAVASSVVYGVSKWEVFGFGFGARDTASGFLRSLFRSYNLGTEDLAKICPPILKESLYIIKYPLYS